MKFVSITFQNIVFKSFKQDIGCLLKGCGKIIHVNGNDVLGTVFRKSAKSAKKPSIDPCETPNIISNQLL